MYLMNETSLPHIETTLNMDWFSIDPGVKIPERTSSSFDKRLINISNRCGQESLDLINKLSRRNRLYTLPVMQSVQHFLVGSENSKFRSSSAFCNRRHERYAYFTDLPKLFEMKVAKDAEESLHPLVKAARLYLDIIFIHPFIDGNARAALSSAVFYCQKYGYNVPDMNRLFSYQFSRPSEASYTDFCYYFINDVNTNVQN